jgi:hypothetical protein
MTKFGYKQTEEHKRKIAEAARGRERSAEYRKNISRAKVGPKNGMWKDKASYQATHTWLRKHHEKPKNCEYCNEEKKLDWASKTKEYEKDINEYIALCRGCHIKLDRYGSISL